MRVNEINIANNTIITVNTLTYILYVNIICIAIRKLHKSPYYMYNIHTLLQSSGKFLHIETVERQKSGVIF